MSQYVNYPVTPEYKLNVFIRDSIDRSNDFMNYKLYLFENKLNIQMLLLENGPNYINDIFDSILQELESNEVVGRAD